MNVGSRLDSGVTALILGFFAVMWFNWGLTDASSTLVVALAVGMSAAVLVTVLGAARAVRSRRTGGALHEQAARRRYGIVAGIELAAAGVGAGAIGVTVGAAYIPVWVCAVVGLHFFPMASVLGAPPLRWLGAVVTGVAAVALLVGVVTGVAPGNVTGVGAGLALLAFATLALKGPTQQRGRVQWS